MGTVNPQIKDSTDFKHKIWNHLIIMSDYQLDVDSPFPKPSRELAGTPPKRLKYATNQLKFKHYGKIIEGIIQKVILIENKNDQKSVIETIANHMKKSYMHWNKNYITDEIVLEHLNILSKGNLSIDADLKLNRLTIPSPNQNNINKSNKRKTSYSNFNRKNGRN